MGPNQFLRTAADPIGHESAYLRSQGRSLNYRCPDFGRHRRPRLCGAETGRLRPLYQQQWTMDIGCRVHAVAQRPTRRPQGQPQSAEMARIASANIPMRAERLPSWRRREPFDSIIGRLASTAEVETTAYPIFVVYILS